MKPRAVLFDFDLTLADSSAGIIECMNHALRHIGLPSAPAQRILETIGLSMPATLECLTGITDAGKEETFTRSFIARADEVMADLTVMYACVPSVVRRLQSAGLMQGIVSSKLRYRIEGILAREQLSDCFQVIVGAYEASHHKPHPAALQLALERLEVAPGDALYVGDHPVDGEAASRAGIPFVAVLTGVSKRAQLTEYAPVAVIDDLSALTPLLGLPGTTEGGTI